MGVKKLLNGKRAAGGSRHGPRLYSSVGNHEQTQWTCFWIRWSRPGDARALRIGNQAVANPGIRRDRHLTCSFGSGSGPPRRRQRILEPEPRYNRNGDPDRGPRLRAHFTPAWLSTGSAGNEEGQRRREPSHMIMSHDVLQAKLLVSSFHSGREGGLSLPTVLDAFVRLAGLSRILARPKGRDSISRR